MKAKPWKCAQACQNNGPNYYVISTGEWKAPVIARCDDNANAVLIAAAPELLEALKGVTRILEAFSYTTALAKNQKDRLDAARAIIAKVTQ